jgi:trk system potassium uptake protein TrkA
MAEKMQIGVIGLGTFGFVFAKRIIELDHDVIGLDVDPDKVRKAQDVLTQVYEGDGRDSSVLEQLGFHEFDHVVVSVGAAMEASVLITLHLKELEANSVRVKAVSWDHEKILRKVGADDVFSPERYAAYQMALSISVPGLVDYLPVSGGLIVRKLEVDKWAGKTLRELDLTNKQDMLVVSIEHVEDGTVYFPKADRTLKKGDHLVVFTRGGDAEVKS